MISNLLKKATKIISKGLKNDFKYPRRLLARPPAISWELYMLYVSHVP